MRRLRRIFFLAVLATTLGCDQLTKSLAEDHLADSPGVRLASGVVHLELVGNPGAFLSLGADLPDEVRRALFGVGVPLALLVIAVLLLRSGPLSSWQGLGLALLVGGGLGNWLDRVLRDGVVTDFVSLGLGPLRTGVFNVADVAIVVGVLLIALASRPAPLQVE